MQTQDLPLTGSAPDPPDAVAYCKNKCRYTACKYCGNGLADGDRLRTAVEECAETLKHIY